VSAFALLMARLILSAAFAVAALAKLADRAGSRQALVDFGTPRLLARPLAILLPFAELAVAAVLLPAASAWLGAVGALSLLSVFLLGIATNLALGRRPNCHCFGQLHSAPAGWPTLARNAVLAALAGLVVWRGHHNPGLSSIAWWVDLTTAQKVGLLAGFTGCSLLAAQCALLLQILKQQGRLLLRLGGLEARLAGGVSAPQPIATPSVGLSIGTRAPGFSLPGLSGEIATFETLAAAGKHLLLIFTNPHCGPCRTLLPEIARWQSEYASEVSIALVSEGTASDNSRKVSAYGVRQVLLQKQREVAERYQAWGTPSAVLVRPDGNIGSSLAQGADAIKSLVAQVLSGAAAPILAGSREPSAAGRNGDVKPAARPEHLKLGDPAPTLQLQDVHGKTVSLSQFRGREVLLLFWNPRCGYCQRMLDDLRAWDAIPPTGAPELVVITTGNVQDSLAMNLRSAVLLDPAQEASVSFGATGTPMAVLLDLNGQVASDVAAGAEAVFALAGRKHKQDTAPTESVIMDWARQGGG